MKNTLMTKKRKEDEEILSLFITVNENSGERGDE